MASKKPENVFRDSVHKHLPIGLHHEKMNNPYRGGTPDDWYSGTRNDLWIEYKWLPKIPIKVPINVPDLFSKLQLMWLNDRSNEGRNVTAIIGCKEGGVILSDKGWNYPLDVNDFRARLLDRISLANWIVSATQEKSP